jgi:MSHA biogenesis protein MshQ
MQGQALWGAVGVALCVAVGLLLPRPAHAQVTFRSASVAAPGTSITHVGAGAAAVRDSTNCGSISPPIPAGNVNDLLIALVIVREDGATISVSAGWTVLYSATYPGGRDFKVSMYYRVATGSDALSVTATNNCNSMAGRVSRFGNVDTAQPFLNVPIPGANVVMQDSNNIDTGTETTVDANAMLLVASFVRNNVTITEGAGWNVSFESVHNLNNRDLTLNLHYELQTTAGAKSISNWALNNTEDNIGIIFSLRPLPPAQPPPVTLTPPAGWTLVSRTDNTNSNANSLAVYIKVAGASEPATYTWGVSSSSGATGGIQSFAGVDISSPIDVQNGQTTASGLAHASPSVTTTVANAMLVTSHAFASAATWTSPSGMAQGFTASSIAAPNSVGISMQCNFVIQATAGTTGAKTATAGNDADVGNGHILALRPAVGAVPTPGAFNAFETGTGAGLVSGVIKTRIAGTAFSLDVVAIASGAQQAGFTDAVIVELLGNNALGVSLDAQNCPISFTLVQTVAPNATITGGRSTVSFAAVADSWRDVRVRVRWPTSSPTVTSCSTDNFAIRPETLASFAVSDTDWQTAGTGRALDDVTFGTVTHKAGRPLSVRATALNAAGTPAVTTNYTGAPTATLSACAGAACTATFGALTLTTTFVAGQLTSDVASYDNVGSFRLELVDASFASVDAADSSALEREIHSGTIDVGRFVPDHFAVSLNTPVLGTACGAFTYLGQAFNYTTGPVVTVTAQGFANNTISLYAGNWWRINNTSLTPNTQAARYSAAGSVALDVGALPGTNSDPAIAASGNGVGTLTFSSTGGIAFSRSTPVVPFDAEIALSIDVIDADSVAFAGNPAKFGDATAGNGIAFSAGKQIRFGRLRLQNAYGPDTVGLQVPLETQYWNALGPAFVRNADDSCTSLDREHITLSGYSLNLNACETAVNQATIAFSGGQGTLTLAAAGAGNTGTVLLTPNLAAASGMYCPSKGGTETPAVTANRAYLQGKWTGASWDENPTARATFGLYGSQPKNFIFFRENY